MIAALAGRRIDAADAVAPRFPLANLNVVRERLVTALKAQKVDTLVCAAACGADLLSLDVAGELGLRRRIILPASRATFREESVVDRPGEWGRLFDLITDEVTHSGDLMELSVGEGQQAFLKANRAVLDEAESLAAMDGFNALAIIVWDGSSRGVDDVTFDFLNTARERGFGIVEVLTL